jgi:Protein of unknown function (DUF1552)
MKVSRRHVLRGLGGAVLGLPWLEGLQPRQARAQSPLLQPFAIFFRQANGVAAEQDTSEIGAEPERFWPTRTGALSTETLSGRALDELASHAERLLVVGNVNMENFNYGDGHARGALQVLTARGPTVDNQGGNSEAAGESIDHRIGRELNGNGNESLFLYAGEAGGWLGGPCISYRGSGNRRSALTSPYNAYQALVGGGAGLPEQSSSKRDLRKRSINDVLRTELGELLARPALSVIDRQRLDLHLSSVRDLEVSLSCNLSDAEERALSTASDGGEDGDVVLGTARLHMDVAVLAVACGYTRSVAIQVGNGNDGSTRYRDPTTGTLMENFHFVSHRRQSHGDDGNIIAGSDLLHHQIDRQFARTFAYLLDKLAAYAMPAGTLLDQGMAVWVNDLGNGPAHGAGNCPVIIGGSAGGFLRQGQYIRIDGGDEDRKNHARVLNTLGSAAGLRKPNGDLIDDFGDPGQARQVVDELLA